MTAVRRDQRCAAEVAELFGMQLDRQAVVARRVEHPARLVRREGDGLAEGIDRIGQPGFHRRRQILWDDADLFQ